MVSEWNIATNDGGRKHLVLCLSDASTGEVAASVPVGCGSIKKLLDNAEYRRAS